MQGERETNASVEKKAGRKKKVRECELHPAHLWCAPCQNRRTKRPCEGPRIGVAEATPSMLLPLVDTHSETPAAASSATVPLDVRRPVRASAGKGPVLLEAEYPYAEPHIRDNRVSTDVAARRPPSQKVKVSALEAAIAERDVKLEVIEGKLKALMKKFKEEQKRADMLAKKEIDRDNHKRQRTLSSFWKPVVERATTSSATAHVDRSTAVGYSKEEQRRTFRRDVENIQTEIIEIAGDDPLRQLQLADGVWKRFTKMKDALLTDEQETAQLVVSNLKVFFHELRRKYHGRFPNMVRAIQQGVCSAIVTATPRGSLGKIAQVTGASHSHLRAAYNRWHDWMLDDLDDLVELRGAVRSDKTPKEWVDHAIQRWYSCCVKSPRKRDSVRNPKDRKDKELYRVYFKEVPTFIIHEDIVKTGKEKFGSTFHWSEKMTRKVRPFEIKPAHREVCACIYHLRWDLFAEALHNFRKKNRESKACNCKFENVKSGVLLRRQLICARPEGQPYDSADCVKGRCSKCSDFKLMHMCDCIETDAMMDGEDGATTITWEELQEIEPRHEGQKPKKDFVKTTTSFRYFMEELRVFYRNKFAYHHQQAKIQEEDVRVIKMLALIPYNYPAMYDLSVYDYSALPPVLDVMPDVCATIEDFSENWNNRPWREHQSRYWVQMGVTLFGMVLYIHIDNVRDISASERSKLKKLMVDNDLPPVVIISVIIISADLTHDAASVYHYNDEIFTPWLQSLTADAQHQSPFRPGHGKRIRIMDGATHFKSAGAAYWVSSQHEKGPRVDNTYGATAHRKDFCDGENGGLKNMASREQANLNDTGGTSRIKTHEDLYNFATQRYHLPPEHIYQNKGRGIYRRVFFKQDATGAAAINRNVPQVETMPNTPEQPGIQKLHQIVNIGIPGSVGVRRASCHRPDCPCQQDEFRLCKDFEFKGPSWIVPLKVEKAGSARLTRSHLRSLGIDMGKKVKEGSIVVIELSYEVEVFMLGRVRGAWYKAAAAEESDWMGTIRVNDELIDIDRLAAWQPGSNVFVEAGEVVKVFIDDIRMINVDLKQIEARSRAVLASRFELPSNVKAEILKLMAVDPKPRNPRGHPRLARTSPE